MHRFFHHALVLLLVACFIALVAGQTTFGSSRLNAQVDQASGTIRIWEAGTDRVFTHKFVNVRELDTDEAVENAALMIDQIYTSSSPAPNNYQGLNATSASLIATISVASSDSNTTSGATLMMNVWIFQEEGTITFDNRSVSVGPEQMFIIYRLQGWPIRTTDNTINMLVRLSTAGGLGSIKDNKLVLNDGGSLTFSETAIGSNYPGGTSTPQIGISSTSDSTVEFTMRFGASTNIEYNALWSVEAENQGGEDDGGDDEGPGSSSAATLSSPLSLFF